MSRHATTDTALWSLPLINRNNSPTTRDEKMTTPVTLVWKPQPRPCLECGEHMPVNWHGPRKRYCSDKCRQRACRARKPTGAVEK